MTRVVVVGAGHAGLAVSTLLHERGVEHVVLERGRVAESWRSRWDSLTLLTPSWATSLPHAPYAGDEPDAFLGRDEVVAHLERYARRLPVREGVAVQALEPGYELETSAGPLHAEQVVVATGPFRRPRVPGWADELTVPWLHSSAYRNPALPPDGPVLVVGAGPSAQQIAEELLEAGRRVVLSVGRHRRVPRRYRGRDYFWWLENTGFYDRTADDVPVEERRRGVSPVLTGGRGGHDLDLRELAARGVGLVGRARGLENGRIAFDDDLAASLAAGDSGYDRFVEWVEQRLELVNDPFDEPEERQRFPEPQPADGVDPSVVVFATGYEPAFSDWIRIPGVLGEDGLPIHRRGVSPSSGLYFVGLHWLYRLRSAFIRGAEEDARYVAELIASA